MSQIDKLFTHYNIETNKELSDKDILFQNDLFRKLMKELNKILDDKIEKKQTMSLKKSPQKNINPFIIKSSKSLESEIDNNKKIIYRQKNEIKQLESRIIQVSKEDYYENLIYEIKKIGNEIETNKKEKKTQANTNILNARSLENIVEIKGLPENLQKSAIIDSDLLIIKIKNKGLIEKIQVTNKKLEETQKKNEKFEEDMEKIMNEASDLKIILKKNYKKDQFDELQTKCNRFQKLLDSMRTKQKKETQIKVKEINELKLKIQEKEKILIEQKEALQNVRAKLSSLLANENIDKSLKDLVNLFTSSNQNNSEISVISSNKNISMNLQVHKDIAKMEKEILEKKIDHLSDDKLELFDENSKANSQNDEKNSNQLIEEITKNKEEIIFQEEENLNNQNFEEIIENDNDILNLEKQTKSNENFGEFDLENSNTNNEKLDEISIIKEEKNKNEELAILNDIASNRKDSDDVSQRIPKNSNKIVPQEGPDDIFHIENNVNNNDIIINRNENNTTKSLKKLNEDGNFKY